MRVGELAVGVGEDNSEGGRVDSEGGREQVDHRNVRMYYISPHSTLPLYGHTAQTCIVNTSHSHVTWYIHHNHLILNIVDQGDIIIIN